MSRKNLEWAIKSIETCAKRNSCQVATPIFEFDDLLWAVDGYECLRTVEEFDDCNLSEATEDFAKLCKSLFADEAFQDCKAVELPDYAELERKIKDFKKDCKSKSRPLWKVRLAYAIDNDLLFDPELLVAGLKATGEKVGYTAGHHKPLYILGEDTQYVLLPCHSQEGELEKGGMKIRPERTWW